MSCIYAWLLQSKIVYLSSHSAVSGIVNQGFTLEGVYCSKFCLFSNTEHSGASPVNLQKKRSRVQCEFDFNNEKEMYLNNYRKSFTVKMSKSS